MNLHGQADSQADSRETTQPPRVARSERGYAMAALLVALAVMAVFLTAAVPAWKTMAKREKETELVWRAGQYVRAILLFRRKYANASPPNLDVLINERFLRKKYKDPMTKDGEFQLVYATDQQQQPGPPNQPNQGNPGGRGTPANPSPQLDPRNRGVAGGGGIVGVVSKSKETSLRVFNGRTKYNEWPFTPETLGIRMQGAGTTPQGPVQGGAAGAMGPGGRRLGPGGAAPRGGPGGGFGLDRPGTRGPSQPGPPPGQPTQPPQRPFGLPPQRPPQ
jgi:type II secretory pathway pseudopilin PulG